MIEQLFTKGKSMSAFPVKLLYDFNEEETQPLKAGVTVSSRNFKKAVDRNRVKRVLREAYRLQKNPLKTMILAEGKSLALFFIYIGKELPDYKEVHEKVGVVLQRLTNDLLKRKKATPETVVQHTNPPFFAADKVLSKTDFATVGFTMPLLTHLLSICKGGIDQTRSLSWWMDGTKAHWQVPSMGWTWV